MPGFRKGELILTSQPYAYVLSNSERGKRCDFCLKSNGSLKRCSQCSFVYFCNKECQTKAWEQHKDECKCIKNAHPKEPTPSLRLLSQLIFRVKRHGWDHPSEAAGVHKRSFGDLESHVEEVKKDFRTCQQMIAFMGTLKDYIGQKNIPSVSEFTVIFGKMVINTFSIWDPEMQSIGSGLYLGASIFDHSCEPNAEVVFQGTTLNVRAVTNIPSTDLRGVYISYIDQLQLTDVRRQQLHDQYYFNCQCSRCTNQHLEELMTHTLVEKEHAQKVEKHSKEEIERIKQMKARKEKPADVLEASLELLSMQEGVLSDKHIYRLKVLDYAFEACIQIAHWIEAVAIGLELIEPYRLFYGEYHPNYCLLLTKVGKIELLLQQFRRSLEHLQQAEESIRISHGTTHHLYGEVTKLMTQCRSELAKEC